MTLKQLEKMTSEMESICWGQDRAIILFLDGRCYHVHMTYREFEQLYLKHEREKLSELDKRMTEERKEIIRKTNIEMLIELYNDRVPFKEMAKLLDVSIPTITREIQQLKSDGKLKKRLKPAQYDFEIKKLLNSGFSKTDIARFLGVDCSTIYRRIRKMGLEWH